MKLATIVVAFGALLSAAADWALYPIPYSSMLLVAAVPLAMAAIGLSSVVAARRQRGLLSATLFVLMLFGALAIFCGVVIATVRIGRPSGAALADQAAQIHLWILIPLFALPSAALGALFLPVPKPDTSTDPPRNDS